jgi:hypothetical protein
MTPVSIVVFLALAHLAAPLAAEVARALPTVATAVAHRPLGPGRPRVPCPTSCLR